MTVWDLLTLCVAWTAVLPVAALVGTHNGGLAAAVGGGLQSASARHDPRINPTTVGPIMADGNSG